MAETKPKTENYMERLNAVNAGLEFTNIKGKDYAQVNQRILAFWSLFPNGRINCYPTHIDENRCDFECKVFRNYEDEEPAATGHAFEVKTGMINSTSYIENCETGAIGRALGVLGIGANTSIASAEEMIYALAKQENEDKSNPKKTAAPKEKKPAATTEPLISSDAEIHAKKVELMHTIQKWAELNNMDAEKAMKNLERNPAEPMKYYTEKIQEFGELCKPKVDA